MADPLFRMGYDDAWAGHDCEVQAGWAAAEARAYRLGHGFALVLQNDGAARMALSRGGLAVAETVATLIRAHLSGALYDVAEVA